MTRTRKIALFVLLAYGLAALLAGGLRLSGIPYDLTTRYLIGVPYMFTPLVAAAAAQRLSGEPVWGPLGARPKLNRWLLVGPGVILIAVALTIGISLLMPGARYEPGMEGLLERLAPVLPPAELEEARRSIAAAPVPPVLLALPQVLIAGLTINAVAAFGEEIGWRGFLQRELSDLGFWGCSIITGILWGFWHAPLLLLGHNYPDHPALGVLLFPVVCALLSPLHSLVRLRSGTVWAAATCHGMVNAAAGLVQMLVAGGSDLTIGMQGLAGVFALILVNVGLMKALGPHPKFYRGRPAARPAV